MSKTLLLQGIPNCDTVKKAKKWLDEKSIDYQFADFKKNGIKAEDVTRWIESAGIDVVLNKRGTTWRKLSPEQQAFNSQEDAVKLICEQPSLVKRPVLENGETFQNGETLQIGFKPDIYETLF